VELTSKAFEKLLGRFSFDREEAASQYEVVRSKLIHFFEWRRIDFADALADETIDRVARRIDEGVEIGIVRSYVWGVARLVLMEYWKPDHTAIPIDDLPEKFRQQVEAESSSEPRLECLDRCLSGLSTENRELITDYYQEERRAKIDSRQQMAEKLQIPLNALRIRAHRIRSTLEKCITKCLESQTEAK